MKQLDLLRYYGIIGFAQKAWEKLVVDPKRFSGRQLGEPPHFPHSEHPALPKPPKNESASEPKAILYLVHYFFPERSGGTERFVLTQAKEQLRRGNRVRVLTLTVEGAGRAEPGAGGMRQFSYEYEGIPVTAFCYAHTPVGLYYKRIDEQDPVMQAFAREQLEEFRPTAVHCAYAQPMAAFLKECRERQIPYLITTTGYDSLCHYTTMLDKTGRLCAGCDGGRRCRKVCPTYGVKDYEQRYQAAAAYLRGACFVAAPSAYVADVLEAEFPKQKVLVIPHGVTRPDGPLPFRQGKVRRFAFVGTLTELKGIPLLIKAFQELKGDFTLSIYGGGTSAYTSRLRRLAAEDPRIRLEGPRGPDEVRQIYENTDCVVVPSLVPETYNFVIREAASSGCLVIGSDIGALTEAVKPGKNGFLFTPGSRQELTKALRDAAGFDWKNYEKMRFTTPREEAEEYDWLYTLAALEKRKGS